ncbi:GFA family protein [Pedomonas sp. V897]|uniref:GFA family protein n=1 Tax=Pedomonas sp. V897 TaxID=3446482 RepID=UPI003EE20733
MSGTQVRSGGCLCGAVRYTVSREPLRTVACHCRDCQKQGGGPMSVLAVYRQGDVMFSGTMRAFRHKAESGREVVRWFCCTCGSPIHSESEQSREKGLVLLKASTFDDISDLNPSAHFWVTSAQPWLTLPSGVELRERQ